MEVTASDNPLIKRLVTLATASGRRAEGLFLAEGSRLIDTLLRAGWVPTQVLVRAGLPVPEQWPDVIRVSEKVAAKLSQATTASGYCAVFPMPLPAPLEAAAGGMILVGVADPGNVGTLIRSAAAFGIRQVVVCGGADPYGPKVVQATAGALALVAVHQVTGPAAVAGGAPCCGLVVTAGVPPSALVNGPRWLVVGGEANGLPADWLAACSERLTLPMPGGTESLNAAIAGSIAAYLLSAGAA